MSINNNVPSLGGQQNTITGNEPELPNARPRCSQCGKPFKWANTSTDYSRFVLGARIVGSKLWVASCSCRLKELIDSYRLEVGDVVQGGNSPELIEQAIRKLYNIEE